MGCSVRKLLKIVANDPGNANIALEAKSGSGHLDKIERQMRIMPLGFPQQVNSSGSVTEQEEIKFEFEIPSKISKNSITASLAFFPSPAGNYEALCDRLCQTPGGCFEQVGSTMFPLVLAAQWFANKGDVDKLNNFTPKIQVGYNKIKGYEVRGGGFEWYGGTPAHTALTAFGVVMLLDTMPVFDSKFVQCCVQSTDSHLLQSTKASSIAVCNGCWINAMDKASSSNRTASTHGPHRQRTPLMVSIQCQVRE